MDHLDNLESQSVFILREAYRKFKNLAMLWSIGKDSTVLLWLVYFCGLVAIFLMNSWLPTLLKDGGYTMSAAANQVTTPWMLSAPEIRFVTPSAMAAETIPMPPLNMRARLRV